MTLAKITHGPTIGFGHPRQYSGMICEINEGEPIIILDRLQDLDYVQILSSKGVLWVWGGDVG